jgi:hypothetical protein
MPQGDSRSSSPGLPTMVAPTIPSRQNSSGGDANSSSAKRRSYSSDRDEARRNQAADAPKRPRPGPHSSPAPFSNRSSEEIITGTLRLAERILDERTAADGNTCYLVRWLACDATHDTWEPEQSFMDKVCPGCMIVARRGVSITPLPVAQDVITAYRASRPTQ